MITIRFGDRVFAGNFRLRSHIRKMDWTLLGKSVFKPRIFEIIPPVRLYKTDLIGNFDAIHITARFDLDELLDFGMCQWKGSFSSGLAKTIEIPGANTPLE